MDILNKGQKWVVSAISTLKHTDFRALAVKTSKDPIFWVRFSAYAIPLAFLGYVLYINYLPFGYNKTFVINVGAQGDTAGEFYLEPSKSLSERKVAPDGTTYRELSGSAFAVFKPNVVLKDATITIEVEGDGVSIIPPYIEFDPSTINWDYSWDFTKGIPKDLTGNAFMFDGEATFNGRDTRLELSNSADLFEDGPFTVYAEWTPKDSENNGQQIVGHYNWELWQNKDSVEFRVGRMNDGKGPAYSVKYTIQNTEFFNIKHTAVAIYNPSEAGYIDLFVDGNFAGRTYFITDTIWKDYGKEDLSFGWTPHNYSKSPHFKGVLHTINISSQNILPDTYTANFILATDGTLDTSLVSTATSTLSRIKLNATQK